MIFKNNKNIQDYLLVVGLFLVPTTNYLINSTINLNLIISITIISLWFLLIKESIKIKAPLLVVLILMGLDLITNAIIIQDFDYLNIRYIVYIIISSVLALSIVSRSNENIIKFSVILCITSILIMVATIIGMVLQIPIYEKLYGFNQNLTAGILLLSLPMINYINIEIKNIKLIKFFYKLITLIVIGLILKSRFSFLLGLIYILFEIFREENFSRSYKLIVLLGIVTISLLVIFNNPRFINLLSGNDILYRYHSWERLIFAGLNNFWFGSGFGSTSIIYNEYQNINPSLEIISGGKTFINSHSDIIEKFIGGGIFSVIIYIGINAWIFYQIYKNKNKNLKYLGYAYILIFMQSQIDVHNSHLGNLVLFTAIQFLLINSFLLNKEIEANALLIKAILGVTISLLIYFVLAAGNLKNHIQNYGEIKTTYYRANISEQCQNLKNEAPHFIYLDTYCLHNYLINNTGVNFNKKIFESLLLDAEKYNKFYLSRLHLASQFYAVSKNDIELKKVYKELLYIILVNNRVIKINYDIEDLSFEVVGSKANLKITNSDKKILIEMSNGLFNDFRLINSSFGAYSIPSEVINTLSMEAESNFINTATLFKVSQNFIETVNLIGNRITEH